MPILRQIVNGQVVYMAESSDAKITVQLTPAEALDLLTGFTAVAAEIQADNQGAPPPVHTGIDTTFHGLLEFNQTNSSTNVNNPTIVGTFLGYHWSQFELSEGQIDFTVLENDLAKWAGKKVLLRISASGWKKWTNPQSTSWTPLWVYSKGAKSVKVDDGSIKPCYWDPVFLAAYQTFLQAYAAKYDGDPRILGIEMGIGDGGETKPDTLNNSDRLKLWQKVGYTDQIWFDTIKKIIDIYTSSFTKTPVILMPDASFLEGKLHESDVLTYAISKGCWLQENGLIPNETLNTLFQKASLVMEQRAASTDAQTLDQELATALKLKATYVLIFSSVLADQKQTPVLAKYAAKAQ